MPSASTTWGSLLAASPNGREIRCQHPVAELSLSGRQKPCGRLIANDLLVRCRRCKAEHNALDIVTITANRDPETLAAFLKEMTCRFWNDKVVDSMIRYCRSIGQSLPPTFTDRFPRWLNERIDLVQEQGFRPVWIANQWILIEYDPLANEGRWGTGDADRYCTAHRLLEYHERTQHYLGLRPSMLLFPDCEELWRLVSEVRKWLRHDDGFTDVQRWPRGDHWLRSSWFWHFDTETGRTTKDFDLSAMAKYEFIVLG